MTLIRIKIGIFPVGKILIRNGGPDIQSIIYLLIMQAYHRRTAVVARHHAQPTTTPTRKECQMKKPSATNTRLSELKVCPFKALVAN